MVDGNANQALEQFLALAKSAKGGAAATLIEHAVAANGLFVFGELLACPNIAQLENNPTYKKHYDLLQLFIYGNCILLLPTSGLLLKR